MVIGHDTIGVPSPHLFEGPCRVWVTPQPTRISALSCNLLGSVAEQHVDETSANAHQYRFCECGRGMLRNSFDADRYRQDYHAN